MFTQLRREGRVADVNDVVTRGMRVKAKVLSLAGTKIRLSMKDVDQDSGNKYTYFTPSRRPVIMWYS